MLGGQKKRRSRTRRPAGRARARGGASASLPRPARGRTCTSPITISPRAGIPCKRPSARGDRENRVKSGSAVSAACGWDYAQPIPTPPPPPLLTDRFFAAAAFANEVHGGQRRLGTQIPYIAHLMIVAGLVLEDGGDETQAIAALLHDAVEDGGGRPMLDRIRAEFGDEVAAIVEACSDSLDPDDTRSWRERKAGYLAHLPTSPTRPRCASRSPTRSTTRAPSSATTALRATPSGTASPTRPSTTSSGTTAPSFEFFSTRHPGPLVEDLRRALAELEDLASHNSAATRRRPRPETLRRVVIRHAGRAAAHRDRVTARTTGRLWAGRVPLTRSQRMRAAERGQGRLEDGGRAVAEPGETG